VKTILVLSVILFLIVFSSCTDLDDNDHTRVIYLSAESIGSILIEDLLSRPDYMIYKTDFLTAVHYAEACAGFGAARFAGLRNDTLTIQRLIHRYEELLQDTVLKYAHHVDASVYGILPLELYIQTNDERFLKQGIELANLQWNDLRPDGLSSQTRFWIDDVWMIGSLQVQAYRATGNTVYLDRAAATLDAYLKNLQRPNGLFHHGPEAPFFWGRGNGWVAAGLAELLSELSPNHPIYPTIQEGYVKMMDALMRYQADDGMWRQLVDVEESWKETSGTAMFGYAMSVGVNNGILTDEKYTCSYRKAWNALLEYIDEQGQLTEVCVGTGKSDDIDYYLTRPRSTGDLHGQAPVLWFAYSILTD
jgi:unsaturated rhamnogalacturonyl hydrolase